MAYSIGDLKRDDYAKQETLDSIGKLKQYDYNVQGVSGILNNALLTSDNVYVPSNNDSWNVFDKFVPTVKYYARLKPNTVRYTNLATYFKTPVSQSSGYAFIQFSKDDYNDGSYEDKSGAIVYTTRIREGLIPIYKIYKDLNGIFWLATDSPSGSGTVWIKSDDISQLSVNDTTTIITSTDKAILDESILEPVSTYNNSDSTPTGGINKDTSNTIEDWMYDNISNPNYSEAARYYESLYKNVPWTMQSFRSIIGLPFHFMDNVDPRVGKAKYGKQFIEDMLYDAPVAILRPGGPVMNSSIADAQNEYNKTGGGILSFIKSAAAYYYTYIDGKTLKQALLGDDETFGEESGGLLETMFIKIFVGKYARFYTFSQDFSKYTEYVNTLCHLFVHFLGIADKKYIRGDGQTTTYAFYNDTWELCESDSGDTLHTMYGPNRAIYTYYEPESQLSQTYTNSTKESELAQTLDTGSNIAKEWAFMAGAGGIDLMNENNVFDKLGNALSSIGSSGLLGRLFGNVAEGVGTIIAGNNLDLPEIWNDSAASTSTTLTIKLVSPYGDKESVFLYVLRPLARLLAMALPRQFGANSYTSPFLVQAFSKGQFNIQCGIVTSISVKRCGNGGESHTVEFIPTELEVTMEIADMYELVTLSNEYVGSKPLNGLLGSVGGIINSVIGTPQAARLLFNNIGLIDFCAAYCGFNLNSPDIDTMLVLLQDILKNRLSDKIEIPSIMGTQSYRFPKWSRELSDAFYNQVQRSQMFISG